MFSSNFMIFIKRNVRRNDEDRFAKEAFRNLIYLFHG